MKASKIARLRLGIGIALLVVLARSNGYDIPISARPLLIYTSFADSLFIMRYTYTSTRQTQTACKARQIGGGELFMSLAPKMPFIHLFAKSHPEGEKCVIVSGTSGPGPSTIKVWSHKPVSIPRYIYIALRI